MDNVQIRKQAFRVEEHANRMHLVSKGRVALSHAIDLLGLGKERRILLPSYIGITDKEGSGVFEPVTARGVGYEFYKLNYDFSIDMDDFREKIKNPSIKAVLVIHYFGFVQCDLEQVLKVCRENNTYLIENCAHALMSKYQNRYLGKSGDVSIFSLHKSLPIPSGGLLVINNDELGNPRILSDHISEESLRLLYRFDLNRIARIRRRNYKLLLHRIKGFPNLRPLYKELPGGIVPLNLPVIIENIDRNEVYFKLLDRNIETTSLYYRIIEQIDKGKFPTSYYISSHILNLPIHQDISEEDIEYMARGLKEVLDPGSSYQ